MEKNVNVDTYLTLSKEGLEATKEEVSKKAIEEYGKKDGKDELYYPDINWDTDELYFEDGELWISGEFFHNGKKLGMIQ